MVPNAIGTAQYADGGRLTKKHYAPGGAYMNRMSDSCGPCRYRTGDRTGEHARPCTAGCWRFSTTTADCATTTAPSGPCISSTGSVTWTRRVHGNAHGVTHRHDRTADGPVG